jgi:hypothetical protein
LLGTKGYVVVVVCYSKSVIKKVRPENMAAVHLMLNKTFCKEGTEVINLIHDQRKGK